MVRIRAPRCPVRMNTARAATTMDSRRSTAEILRLVAPGSAVGTAEADVAVTGDHPGSLTA
jgi:hypothetical protein